ncbi:MAG: tetratricopeptide repeat protein [Acidobacteriales bacterium]|nr:tetratricopeptide repeat protein [Terriglobales bacterium]
MRLPKFFELASTAALAAACVLPATAGDLKINIPKPSSPTPVQKLNQDGVRAINKHDFKKAEKLFYRAYLIDPNDPFTLNNLGYISELNGQVDRALKFYQLASTTESQTTIYKASIPELKGKKLTAVTGNFENRDLRINRANIEAMSLLQSGRTVEAENELKNALEIQPNNPFTLNNLGYTMEAEGDLQSAMLYYQKAASINSSEKVIVTPDPHWRGKPVSEISASNVSALQRRISTEQSVPAQVARYNLQGVFALNHNQADKARELFLQAYKLDPDNAFSLNNMGYVSEMQGDRETAQEFYAAARRSEGARSKVTVTNRPEAIGQPLTQVATDNSQAAENAMETVRESRQKQGGPIVLRRRDNTPVTEPETPPQANPATPPAQNSTPPSNTPPSTTPPPTQPPQ